MSHLRAACCHLPPSSPCPRGGEQDGCRGGGRRRCPAAPTASAGLAHVAGAAAWPPALRASLTCSSWDGSVPRHLIGELFLAPVAAAAEEQECFAFVSEAAWLQETSPPASGFHLWPFGEHEGCWSFNSLLTPSSPGSFAWPGRAAGSRSFPTAAVGAAPCPLHPHPRGGGEASSRPGCSAVIRLTPGAGAPLFPSPAAPWPCRRLQRAGTARCPGRTGTPGWGRACGSGTGSPRPWGNSRRWTGPAAGHRPSYAPGCRVPCIGARWHARLQGAMCWCPLACSAARRCSLVCAAV